MQPEFKSRRDSQRITTAVTASVTGIMNPDGSMSDREIPSSNTTDISLSGMRMVLAKFVREKSSLRIEVEHKPSNQLFSVYGDVVWVRGDEGSTGYLTGIRLREIESGNIGQWRALVDVLAASQDSND